MRRLRMGVGLVAAVCTLGVASAPALAGEFISSGGHSKGKGEEQTFKLGPFAITCERAQATGGAATPLASPTFATSVKFQKCTTKASLGGEPIALRTKFETPVAIEYHANGFVEVGSELEETGGEAHLAGGTIELRINSIKCTIVLPEQTIPRAAERRPDGTFGAASYSNETAQVGQHTYTKLLISNEFKGIHFEYGEGQCASFKTSEEEREHGKYTGELLEEIPHGNLEYSTATAG